MVLFKSQTQNYVLMWYDMLSFCFIMFYFLLFLIPGVYEILVWLHPLGRQGHTLPGSRTSFQEGGHPAGCDPGWSHVVASQACGGQQPAGWTHPFEAVPGEVRAHGKRQETIMCVTLMNEFVHYCSARTDNSSSWYLFYPAVCNLLNPYSCVPLWGVNYD